MTLIHLPGDASIAAVVEALDMEGYCIIDNAVAPEVMDDILSDMARYLDSAPVSEAAVVGKKTRRLGALPGRSPASHQVIMHPIVLGAARAFLCRNATTVQLNLSQIIAVSPGEQAQFLHRDETAWDFFSHFPQDVFIEVSTMWAVDDFTEENGATRVVPRSHRHAGFAEDFTIADTLPAEMTRGSVLLFTGKTVHGAGANRSKSTRIGLNIDYCVGWVRQEENQYLTVPIEKARTLPEGLRNLMGYQLGASAMGYVRDYEDPIVALYPERGVTPADVTPLVERAATFSPVAASALETYQ